MMTIKKIIPMLLLAMFLMCGSALAEDGELLNVNSATAEQLVNAVPDLSMEVAQGIIEYREDMGDIQDMDELLDVDGMDKALLDKVKQHVGLEALSGSECSC